MSVTELGPHEQEFERTPPHDIAAEQGVLGGMLLSQDAIAEVIEVLNTQDFYRPAHQVIFDTILDLYGRGDPADAVTVAGELTKRGDIGRIGGAPYLHTLISSVPTAANAGYYAKIVRERSVLRKLVETGTRIVQMGYAADGADADEVLDRAQAEVFAIAEKRTGEDYLPLSEIMPGALDEIEAIGSRGGQMVGVPTGFADLDALTNGLHPGQMIVIAARPAMGKALALDTPLPTPTGWTTMGEVEVGDLLIGADGRPTRVVAATEVMHGRPCYEVEFSDGEVIVADARHQWRTTTTRPRHRPRNRRHGERAPIVHRALYAVGEVGAHREVMTAPMSESMGVSTTASTIVGAETRAATGGGAAAAIRSAGSVGSLLARGTVHRAGHAGAVLPPTGPDGAARRTGAVGAARATAPMIPRPSRRSAGAKRREADAPHRPITAIRTTEEIAATLRRDGDGRPAHAVEVAAPFRLPHAELPVDPYVLGVWLGADADTEGEAGVIPGLDEEIAERLEAAGQEVVRHGTPGRFALPGLAARLKGLDVWADKHIPARYLRASEEQRRALLAGLLDTCGLVSQSGRVELAVAGERLAADVRELLLGLGHQAEMTAGRGAAHGTGPSAPHRVGFTPTARLLRSSRKAARWHAPVRPEARVRHIVAVRPVQSVPVRCVQVDNADHMYLAGRSCIPTHNSTLALDFARAASIKHGLTSAFFSLEMGRNEITMRLLSAEARVALHAMRSGTMQDEDWTRLARRMSEVAEAPLFIDDSPNMSMMEIRAKCRRLKQQHDLRLVIVDYLQLMTSGKRVESRQVEVSEFSRSLKLLAKELGVPVIALSQLNRGPEQRTDKKPMVSDLRESGCVTAATRVLRADTNTEITIGELVAGGVRDVPVWALDERLRYVPRTMTHAFSSGRKEVFRLTLASGREIEATANHPFLAYEGWTRLDRLRRGTRIAVSRHVPPPLTIEPWPRERVVLLAHLLGGGSSLDARPLRYSSKDEACLSAVTEAARHFGATAARDEESAADRVTGHVTDRVTGRITTLRLSGPSRSEGDPIGRWLDGLGFSDARERFVPAPVFSLPKEQVALFLRHLWAAGGRVDWDAESNRCRVSYASTGRRLLDDISRLLLRFGIISRIGTADETASEPGHVLDVDGPENQLAFFESVSVHGARGVVAASAVEGLRGLGSKAKADGLDHEVWGDVRRILTGRGTPRPAAPSPSAFRTDGESSEGERLGRVATVLDGAELDLLATNDVFWDEVVGIESIGEREVYDATVAGLHNFVANGISVHNSIEQDADMVILLHREDAYEKESPRAGEADLIVAKHRNGPTATVTVAFQGHYSRFVDMAQ